MVGETKLNYVKNKRRAQTVFTSRDSSRVATRFPVLNVVC